MHSDYVIIKCYFRFHLKQKDGNSTFTEKSMATNMQQYNMLEAHIIDITCKHIHLSSRRLSFLNVEINADCKICIANC